MGNLQKNICFIYPINISPGEIFPWKRFHPETQTLDYIQSVYSYALEGNIQSNWTGSGNPTRKWYHVPWLHPGENGREFTHGLTRERSSEPKELHQNQTKKLQNWAVGLYNPVGGYTIGQVWKNKRNPDPKKCLFQDGAVTIKLLFTEATPQEVPFLEGSLEIEANILQDLDIRDRMKRTIKKLRLLQIDLAVKDDRLTSTTGWLFATLMYHKDNPGGTPWEKVPI